MLTKSEFTNQLCEWLSLTAMRIIDESTPEIDRIVLVTERTAYAEAFHVAMEALSNEDFYQ